jgi:hypothetical protein
VKRTERYAHGLLRSQGYLSQNRDSGKSPHISLSPVVEYHPSKSIFCISGSIQDDIWYRRPHEKFFSVPCGEYSIFKPAFGRRTFHPRLQNGVFASHLYIHAIHIVVEKEVSERRMMVKQARRCGAICRICVNNKESKYMGSVRDHWLPTPKEEWNRRVDIHSFEGKR